MGMNATQLIKMANQIGAFFASQPDAVQARVEYAQHLRRQWDPQMRTALYAHLDACGGEGLSEFALQVLRESRGQIEPRPATV
ncbi:formate dehydrogenase subunit delta [Pseudomonas sp. Z8(2022)]|jgi:formate dehydrogenase subunit delta|uniref:formate dehydrogenase subunit delta n=1 Tax=Pseudomonadaceae TaxID=135621 RepID=UPI0021F3D360|nr:MULTISPECIES: formate dehydrogenase subunit delta [Pseudomonas]UYP30149.1 formate dehydrogenase subunit delta [Pseudomonas sp. Z8(2022)]